VLHAKWDADSLGSLMTDKGLVTNNNLLLFSLPMSKLVLGAGILSNKITGHWKNAFYETKEVGLELAVTLEEDTKY
jgi:hypothetical protein